MLKVTIFVDFYSEPWIFLGVYMCYSREQVRINRKTQYLDMLFTKRYKWSNNCFYYKNVIKQLFLRESQIFRGLGICRLAAVGCCGEKQLCRQSGWSSWSSVDVRASPDLKLLLQMKWSMAWVMVCFAWGAWQARVSSLDQKHLAAHRLNLHLTPCGEIYWTVQPVQRQKVLLNLELATTP